MDYFDYGSVLDRIAIGREDRKRDKISARLRRKEDKKKYMDSRRNKQADINALDFFEIPDFFEKEMGIDFPKEPYDYVFAGTNDSFLNVNIHGLDCTYTVNGGGSFLIKSTKIKI